MTIPPSGPDSTPRSTSEPVRLPLSWSVFRRRLVWLKWLGPAGLIVLVILYELGPSEWIRVGLGPGYHTLAEILVYGTIGPLLAFLFLEYLGRWLEERETSELQAMILAQARENARLSRELSDNTLQALFAISVLLDTAKTSGPELPPEVTEQLRAANTALDRAIRQLREHLLNPPK